MTKQELEKENERLKETVKKLEAQNKKLESICKTAVVMRQEVQGRLRQYE